MKRICSLLLCVCLLSGCNGRPSDLSTAPDSTPVTWEEHYNLGLRYLSEGNYQEAILAFTAAIEIDAKRAEAYVGRGDAYSKSSTGAGILNAAKTDYQNALDIDDMYLEAYIGLAEVYMQQSKYDEALSILKKGLEKTGDSQLEEYIKSVEEIKNDSLERQPRFERKGIFKAYDDLDEVVQQSLETMQNLLYGNEFDSLFSMMLSNGPDILQLSHSYQELRTYLGDHKVSLKCVGEEWTFEVRPEHGEARLVEYYVYEMKRADAYEIAATKSYVIGECVNWNWNGNYERIREISDNTEYSDFTTTRIETDVEHGVHNESLVHGDVFVEIKMRENYSNNEVPEINQSRKIKIDYDHGKKISEVDLESGNSRQFNDDIGYDFVWNRSFSDARSYELMLLWD